MDDAALDSTWLTTDKTPAISRSKGYDTCSRINALLAYTSVILTVIIPDIGEFRVTSVQPMEDPFYVYAKLVDSNGKDFAYQLIWYINFKLYLGVR